MFSEVLLTFAILTVILTRETLGNAKKNEKLFLQVRPEPSPYPFITRMATERLNLTCKMFNRTDSFPVNAYNLTWRVPKDVVNSSGIVPYKFNDGTLGLGFFDLNETHSGDYTCQAETIGLRFTVKLNIKPFVNKGISGKSYCGTRMFVCSTSVLLSNNNLNNQTQNNLSLSETHSPCISDAFVCDGKPDCPNHEDEAKEHCGLDVCAGKLLCNDNRCIPKSWCSEKIPHECCNERNNFKTIMEDVKGTFHNTIMKTSGDFDKHYRFSTDYGEHVFEGSYLRSRDSKSGVDFLHITIYTIIACAIALTIIVLVLVTMLCKTYLSNRRHFEQEANYQPPHYGYTTYQDMNRFRPAIYRNANYQYPPINNPRVYSEENDQAIRENCSIRNLITRWLGLIRGNNEDGCNQDEEEMSRRMNLLNHGTAVNTRYNERLNLQPNYNNRANTQSRQIAPTGYSIVSQYDESLPARRANINIQNDAGEQNTEIHNIDINSLETNAISQPSLWSRFCTTLRITTSTTNSITNTENPSEIFEDVNLNDLSDSNAVPAYTAVDNNSRQANNVNIPTDQFGQGLWSPSANVGNDTSSRNTLWSRICASIGLGSARVNTDNNLNAGTPIHSEDVFEQADLNLNFNEILSSDEDFLTRLEDISRNVLMVSPPPYTELMLNEPPIGPPPPYASRDDLADMNNANNNASNKIAEQNHRLGINEGVVVGSNNIENECVNGNEIPSTSSGFRNDSNIDNKNNEHSEPLENNLNTDLKELHCVEDIDNGNTGLKLCEEPVLSTNKSIDNVSNDDNINLYDSKFSPKSEKSQLILDDCPNNLSSQIENDVFVCSSLTNFSENNNNSILRNNSQCICSDGDLCDHLYSTNDIIQQNVPSDNKCTSSSSKMNENTYSNLNNNVNIFDNQPDLGSNNVEKNINLDKCGNNVSTDSKSDLEVKDKISEADGNSNSDDIAAKSNLKCTNHIEVDRAASCTDANVLMSDSTKTNDTHNS